MTSWGWSGRLAVLSLLGLFGLLVTEDGHKIVSKILPPVIVLLGDQAAGVLFGRRRVVRWLAHLSGSSL